MMHSRIEYPRLEEGGEKSKNKSKTRKLVAPGAAPGGKAGSENAPTA
jgi:hypothetical protein